MNVNIYHKHKDIIITIFIIASRAYLQHHHPAPLSMIYTPTPMEALIHWDFSPGQALADQVRARFGSTVHFSPSARAKEFFLVVSFTSASFALSEESIGVALQCCIGGLAKGFKVFR